ncbi:MAG: signal peptidase I [Bacilli bacterium]|nr:signal peptidase I [Bacilli bacterium]
MRRTINWILKIISSAIFIVLVLIICVLIFYIVRVNMLANNDRLGTVRINIYTILTQSMYPTIKAGDVVVTYREDNNRYNTGDVITFISQNNAGMTITHRVKEVISLNDEYSYRTKGDNNNTADSEIIKGDNVVGRVILKVPKVGYIQQFLVSKTGWIVAVVLPALGIIIYDLLKIFLIATGIRPKNSVEKTLSDENNKRIKDARERLKEVVDDEE